MTLLNYYNYKTIATNYEKLKFMPKRFKLDITKQKQTN